MDKRKAVIASGLVLLFLGLWGLTGNAADASAPEQQITIVGGVDYAKSLNGYVVQDDKTEGVHGQYLIANPNKKVLDKLAKTGQTVVVTGYLSGSFMLEVTSIDGKVYNGQ